MSRWGFSPKDEYKQRQCVRHRIKVKIRSYVSDCNEARIEEKKIYRVEAIRQFADVSEGYITCGNVSVVSWLGATFAHLENTS